MNQYTETIKELFKQTSFPDNSEHSLNKILGDKKIVLYGAGDGLITFSVFVLRVYGLKPQAVLDRKLKSGDIHFGIPAFSPDDYKPSAEEKDNCVVVVTVGKREYHEEIYNSLYKLGFKNIVLASDIYEYHLLCRPKDLIDRGFDYYLDNKTRIMDSFNIFTDRQSHEIYACVLKTHMRKMVVSIPNQRLEEQYFPKNINFSKGYSRVIDCGAYVGDTVKRLNSLFGKIDAIALFEPDLKNFRLLTDYLSKNHYKIARDISVFPCGVYDHEVQLRFLGGNLINSIISEQGDSIIQCTAIDHALPNFQPTFITMDVEGVEPEALVGAEKTIKENRPDLAICVYHAPNHLWDIPLYLNSLRLGYKFYLRNYTSFVSETVLYATV